MLVDYAGHLHSWWGLDLDCWNFGGHREHRMKSVVICFSRLWSVLSVPKPPPAGKWSTQNIYIKFHKVVQQFSKCTESFRGNLPMISILYDLLSPLLPAGNCNIVGRVQSLQASIMKLASWSLIYYMWHCLDYPTPALVRGRQAPLVLICSTETLASAEMIKHTPRLTSKVTTRFPGL